MFQISSPWVRRAPFQTWYFSRRNLGGYYCLRRWGQESLLHWLESFLHHQRRGQSTQQQESILLQNEEKRHFRRSDHLRPFCSSSCLCWHRRYNQPRWRHPQRYFSCRVRRKDTRGMEQVAGSRNTDRSTQGRLASGLFREKHSKAIWRFFSKNDSSYVIRVLEPGLTPYFRLHFKQNREIIYTIRPIQPPWALTRCRGVL